MTDEFDIVLSPQLDTDDIWESSAEWLNADKVKNGNYNNWLRVMIETSVIETGAGGKHLKIIYRSTLDEHRWKLQQCYFASNGEASPLLAGLMRTTDLNRLNKESVDVLVNQRLEIKVATRSRGKQTFVNVIDHQKITELKSVASTT